MIGVNWAGDYYYDVITAGALIVWAWQRIIRRQAVTALFLAAEKAFIWSLLLGCIPIMVGMWNGNEHLFYAYRFFAYSIWVPFIMLLFHDQKQVLDGVKFILSANGIFVFYAVGLRLLRQGFFIGYLPISYEINTLCAMILLGLILFRVKLFRSNLVRNLMATISIVAIILDPTRRVYIFCGVSGSLIIGYALIRRRIKMPGMMGLAAAVIIGLVALHFTGLDEHIAGRLGTLVGYASGAAEPATIDDSVGFRAQAFSIGWAAVKEHPFLGIGTGYDTYLTGTLIDIGGAYKYKGGGTHSFVISALRHYGALVLIPTLIIWGGLLRRSWRIFGSDLADAAPGCRGAGQAVLFGFAGFAAILIVTAYCSETFLHIWLFCGLALGMANQIVGQPDPPVSP